MPKIKQLNISEGTSITAPTDLNIAAAELKVYASESAYVTAKGSAAENGDCFYDSTAHKAKIYKNGAWSEMGSGGAGGTNFVSNTDAEVDTTGMGDSGTGTTVSQTTTASEIPLTPYKETAIKILNNNNVGDYSYIARWTMPESVKNYLCQFKWWQRVGSAYSSSDFNVEVWTNASSDYTGAWTEVSLYEDDSGGDSFISAVDGEGAVRFLADDTADYYEIRIVSAVAGGTANDWVSLNDLTVNAERMGSTVDPRWPSYDSTEVTMTGDGSPADEKFIPYQTADGFWHLRFSFTLSGYTGATVQPVIPDISAKGRQAIVAWQNTGAYTTYYAFVLENSGTVSCTTSSASSNIWYMSGDIALNSKPTWATKVAPDVYLAGSVNASVVVAGAYLSADQTINTNPKAVAFDTEIIDTHNGLNLSTGAYTVQSTGIYEVTYSLKSHVGGSAPTYLASAIQIDGSGILGFCYKDDININSIYRLSGSTIRELTVGQVITVVGYDPSNDWIVGGHSSDEESYFTIAKIPSPQEVANAIVGFGLATSDKEGLVKKNKYQIDMLSASHTGDGDITGATALGFSNLTAGNTYRLSYKLYLTVDAATGLVVVNIRSGASGAGTIYDKIAFSEVGASSQIVTLSSSLIFVAASTSVYFNASSFDGTVVEGDGSMGETWAMLEELNNYEVTTEW